MSKAKTETPLMQQYWDLKKEAGDSFLFFRMGDFYELFGDDAVEASKLLGITLTTRDRSKPNPTPMAGVPHHSADGYIQKLLKAGRKVSIGEQVESPSASKGIVKREIVRTFTPAVRFDIEKADSHFLGWMAPLFDSSTDPTSSKQERPWGLVCIESSTGEFSFDDRLDPTELRARLVEWNIRHLIVSKEHAPLIPNLTSNTHCLVEFLDLDHDLWESPLKQHVSPSDLEKELHHPVLQRVAGNLVRYLCRTQKVESFPHLKPPSSLRNATLLQLGAQSAQHLDLIPSHEEVPNLFDHINRTKTAMGSRKLKNWLLKPMVDLNDIQNKQSAVRELSQCFDDREALRNDLSPAYDLDRILGRAHSGLISPRDTRALGVTLESAEALLKHTADLQTDWWRSHRELLRLHLEPLKSLQEWILNKQKDPAPLTAKEGEIFQLGTTPELDRLIQMTTDGKSFLIQLESKERESTQIPTLKVRYNRVFGYYIEVTKTHAQKVPSHYERKQSMTNAERFFTPELKTFEEEMLSASAKQKNVEESLFQDLIVKIRSHAHSIQTVSEVMASIDAMAAITLLLDRPGWCLPAIDRSYGLSLQGSRHPLVDRDQKGDFVPNDIKIEKDRPVMLVTGPNMGGKSTLMRQAAITIILGQMGCPVPASNAQWGVVDSVFTRIGAHDSIAQGQSTFMVEMIELAEILKHASKRSLVVLDEVGRGTSTFDGLSVAWSALEHLCNQIQCRTFFATHYHELTDASLSGMRNTHMAVELDDKHSLKLLYELREGPSNESFGIYVAEMAGVPESVTRRAWEIMQRLEEESTSSTSQLSFCLEDTSPKTTSKKRIASQKEPIPPWILQLAEASPDEMPLSEVLNHLKKWKNAAQSWGKD